MRHFRKTNMKFLVMIIASAFLFNILGCAHLTRESLDTNHKRSNFLMQNFDAFIETYNAQIAWPDLSANEKNMLKGKRALAFNTKMPIDTYCSYTETGQFITPDLTNKAFNYLDQLLRSQLTRYSVQSMGVSTQTLIAAKQLQKSSYDEIKGVLQEVGLIEDGLQAQLSPAIIATLIELVRQSIHAAVILLNMKGQTDEEAETMFASHWPSFKTYDLSAKLPQVQ